MKNVYKFFIPIFLIITLVSACDTDKLENVMIEFDRAFIPVFYYTYNEDLAEASKAMFVLERKWELFNYKIEKHSLTGHNWEESFVMISAWLEEANCAIKNQDADLALIQLDHARYELMDLRWREGMTYYLDKVWDLEATIDIVAQVSSSDMLELIDWKAFRLMTFDVEDAWNDVSNSSWEKQNFKFNSSEKKEEFNRKLALGFAIKNFTIAVDYADSCDIVTAAKQMEKSYLEYISVFGDFDSTKTFYAAN